VHVTFIDKDGTEIPLEAPVGKSVLELAHDNKIDLEGGMSRLSSVLCTDGCVRGARGVRS
jgi:hypothetical protein